MITGSHIPADRNGIKFYLKTGETLKPDEQAIFKIYEELKTKALPPHSTESSTTTDAAADARELYLKRYLDFFPEGSLSGLKLLFLSTLLCCSRYFPEILEKLGAEVIRVGKSDTFIPVDTEAVESVDLFKEWILTHKAAALISTDGDADRPLFVDESGVVLPGDKIGALTSLYLGCDAIALPISCNSGIHEVPQFKKIVATQIGSPYVVEALNQLSRTYKKVAGFEANGGYLLQTDLRVNQRELLRLPTRDAVLPVVSILALAKKLKIKTSELSLQLPKRSTASGLLKNFEAEKSLQILESASKNPSAFFKELLPEWPLTIKNLITLDGLRCEFEGGMVIHLRPSGNAPEFRCYTEALEQSQADALGADVLKALAQLP
ncbi:MAG: phosphomannomutase [Bdellovibrionaceae bacterium]|nr:phosphomannomutase [Pseudobdellovibrionaceae bacterium]